MTDPEIHRAEDCVAAGGRTHLAADCFDSGPWPPARSAPSQETCAAKLGKPDLVYGMMACGLPVEYLAADGFTAAEREDNPYSGWRHVDREIDRDHWPVPKRAYGL